MKTVTTTRTRTRTETRREVTGLHCLSACLTSQCPVSVGGVHSQLFQEFEFVLFMRFPGSLVGFGTYLYSTSAGVKGDRQS
jgi:hypothetical protein